MVSKEKLLKTVGNFTWDFGNRFFIETEIGNFIWSCPDYNGNNTIEPYDGSYKEWIGNSIGRDKGLHLVENYCGKDIKLL